MSAPRPPGSQAGSLDGRKALFRNREEEENDPEFHRGFQRCAACLPGAVSVAHSQPGGAAACTVSIATQRLLHATPITQRLGLAVVEGSAASPGGGELTTHAAHRFQQPLGPQFGPLPQQQGMFVQRGFPGEVRRAAADGVLPTSQGHAHSTAALSKTWLLSAWLSMWPSTAVPAASIAYTPPC